MVKYPKLLRNEVIGTRPVRTFIQQTGIRAVIAAEKPIYDITKGKHARNRFLSSLDIPYVGSSPYNSGLFDAMKKNGSQAIFAGHDHVNDWAAKYEGIWLVYNQYASYNAYGLWDYNGIQLDEKDWQQAVTVTEVHKDGTIDLSQRFHSKYLDK